MSIPAIASVTKIGPSTSVSVTESIAQMQSQLNQLEQAEISQSNVETRAQLEVAVEQVEEQLQQAQQAAQPSPAAVGHPSPSAPPAEAASASSAPAPGATIAPSEPGPTLNAVA